MNGSVSQNFPKFEPLRKFEKNRVGLLLVKIRLKSGPIDMNKWVTFSWKIGYVWIHFQIPSGMSLTKPKLSTPWSWSRIFYN